jgi:hypothetical protein
MVGIPRKRLAVGIVVASLAATVVGCGSSASTTPQSVASNSPSPTPTASPTVSPAPDVSTLDACTLLTDREAAQVVGAAVTHTGSNNPGTRACEYKTGAGAASTAAGAGTGLPVGGFLSVAVSVSPSAAAARAALVTQSQGFLIPGRPNPETTLPNLGDGGFVLVLPPGLADISFSKGMAFVSIQVNNVATTKAALEAAAQAVLNRL